MQNNNHIIMYQKGYSETENFNYWAYRQGRRLLRFNNKYEFIYYFLGDAPELITKEMLSPEIMMCLVNLYGTSAIHHLLNVVSENEIPESVKICAARKDAGGSILSYLQKPSNDIINIALETAGQNLIHIKKPTKQQILLGLDHETETPWLISKIKKPTVQMQIKAVMHDFNAIDYIKEPCETVKIAAAKAHGVEILRKIKNPSEQVLLTAIHYTFDNTKEFFTYYIPRPNHRISCAINEQIKLVKQALMAQNEERPKQKTDPKHFSLGDWPTENELSSKEKEIRQEIDNILKTNYFAPSSR